jgi:hypothetical protein
MRFLGLATIVWLAGCASSQELAARSSAHMANARQAAAVGNYEVARAEQRKGEEDYQRATDRAWHEGRPSPAPPDGAPLPVFEPQMERWR